VEAASVIVLALVPLIGILAERLPYFRRKSRILPQIEILGNAIGFVAATGVANGGSWCASASDPFGLSAARLAWPITFVDDWSPRSRI
jgi:hypothetical protein